MLVLSLVVGAGAGLGAVAFRYMILGFTYAFTGHRDYSAAGHASNPQAPGLGIWFVVLAPVIGGLIYGPLVSRFAPEARGHGVPEVMLAVNRLGGRMRPQVPIVKSLASALCIGSGGSVGREGPIVQIGSALGSVLGQLVRVTESQLRLLVACGAAAGISATFNAPIAGVFFALELILRNFDTESFGFVVLSSVTADAIGRAAFGSHPFLTLPGFTFSSPLELVLYAGLGVLAVGVGLTFVRVLYAGEDLADRLWRGPSWLRPAAGGILLGLLLLAVPQMYGVGYPVLQHAVAGHYVILALLGLLVAKILATSLTMWIGGSGGVFAPSLFMGAMLGTAYGAVAHHLLPGLAAAAGAYGLVGMGAVFAATARAPITGLIIIFELTGNYRIILPLMCAIVVATALSNHITKDTIYTLKLRRRGIDIDAPRTPSRMAQITVHDAMGRAPKPLKPDQPLPRDRQAVRRRANRFPAGHQRRRVAHRRHRRQRRGARDQPRDRRHATGRAPRPRRAPPTRLRFARGRRPRPRLHRRRRPPRHRRGRPAHRMDHPPARAPRLPQPLRRSPRHSTRACPATRTHDRRQPARSRRLDGPRR